ncbi:hypothetical protein [Actinoplanes sp. NPDC051411]|uniref:hypothetical protein n=1 Tax=Actinoplanes sp. NPDC051411 TaxID=3155522 RepID=UPI0034402376
MLEPVLFLDQCPLFVQGSLPAGFQLPDDEPVLRVDGLVAAAGVVDVDLGSFQPQIPQLLEALPLGVDLRDGVQAHRNRGGGQRLQDGGGANLVDAAAGHALADRATVLGAGSAAVVTDPGFAGIDLVGDGHPALAVAAALGTIVVIQLDGGHSGHARSRKFADPH